MAALSVSWIETARLAPSGLQAKERTPSATSVSGRASPPSGRMSHTCVFPSSREERKAIHLPSGDQAGLVELPFAVRVSWKGAAPGRTSQISVSYRFASQSAPRTS